jgi:gluconolactonase
VLAKDFQGRRFGGPNDCWVDQDGSIYVTDPLYKRPYWTQTFPNDHPRGVYRLGADGNLTQVADDLVQPNGIVGDSSKRILYVADINARRTYRYRIAADGSLVDKQLFCESGSDGMTIDERGNLYLTGNRGVTVYGSDGTQIQVIPVPRGWTANVTFAGPQRQHLFITAGDAVFVIETTARGLPSRSSGQPE